MSPCGKNFIRKCAENTRLSKKNRETSRARKGKFTPTKKHHGLIGNPPTQRPQILFMWGAACLGSPWDCFGRSSTRMLLQRLDKCHCSKAKSHVRPDGAKKQRWKCGLELWSSESKQRDSERIRSPSRCSQQNKYWCQILNGTWVTVFEARGCANRRIGNPFPPSICADLDLQTPIPNMSPAITSPCVNVYPSHHNQALKSISTNPFFLGGQLSFWGEFLCV